MKRGSPILWLIPSGPAVQICAALWTASCVSLLVYALLHRNDSPYDFGTAEMFEQIGLTVLCFPASLLAFLSWDALPWPKWANNDWRTICLGWSFWLLVGYLQWFVLLRALRVLFAKTFDSLAARAPVGLGWIHRRNEIAALHLETHQADGAPGADQANEALPERSMDCRR